MTIITLTTDFGLKDGNVGVMKGVILSIAPSAQLVDISHLIGPQNILEAALILARSTRYFPAGTVHLAVIDPGVGTDRRPMAARVGSQLFVLPDNGIITRVFDLSGDPAPQFIQLARPEFWLPNISNVFHGRDIFAPVAAHLATGVPLQALGDPIAVPIRIDFPEPRITKNRLLGSVIHIDHFGNLTTSIRREHIGQKQLKAVMIGNVRINDLAQTFGDHQAGDLIALYGSNDDLIIAKVNGSAAEQLNSSVGEPVEVMVTDERD